MQSNTLDCNITTSSNYFRDILLHHSVERSPKFTLIFSQTDVKLIVDYVYER